MPSCRSRVIPGERPVQPALISMKVDGDRGRPRAYRKVVTRLIEWIIAITFQEKAVGAREALAARIIVALT